MPRSILSVTLVSALCVIGAADARAQSEHKPFDHVGLAQRALEGHIIPSYTRLGEATKALEAALQAACRAPAAAVPRAVATAYDEVVSRWGAVEQINFGPATAENRLDRFLFFPDRRGLGARQVAKALEIQDAAVLDATTLGARSVGLQSLSALDIVLFQPKRNRINDGAALDYRCRYALSIAGNLNRIARDILAEWSKPDGFRRTWLEPGPGNAAYQKPTETTMALSKALLQGLERLRDERVGGPLGFGKQRHKTQAALPMSGRTLLLIVGNIDGLINLYRNGGIEDAIRESHPGEAAEGLPAKVLLIENEMKTARGIAQQLVNAPKPFDDKATVQRLIAMGFPLRNARDQAMGLLTLTAGITLGFNASDGD
jgi:predicted lipoprotein